MPSLKVLFSRLCRSEKTTSSVEALSLFIPRLSSELFDIIISAFVSSNPSVEDRLGLWDAAKLMSSSQSFTIHRRTCEDLYILSPQHVFEITQDIPSYSSTRSITFTIADPEEEEIVDTMQTLLEFLVENQEALPSLSSLTVNYHNTPYSHTFEDVHIHRLPPTIRDLRITFTHTDPHVAERMKKEYDETFKYTVDIYKMNPTLGDLATLAVHGAPDKFVKHFAVRCSNVVGLEVDQETELRTLKGFIPSVQSISRR
ncbi:hypothetical protein DL96DRAFT_1560737 [Flagelloscypha sp. PMI_526]|nr:hypothetical protein DL96DRAFT_1560737 [Flagelloscypha sp. PMI_526]